MEFENYKVLVVGSTSGIGLATTKMFLDEGATVIGLGRNFDKTKDLGDTFIPYKCDVTDPNQIKASCDFVKKTFGNKLDVLVDSAGIGVHESVKSVTIERFDEAINLLLRHHVFFTAYLCESLYNGDSKDPVIIHVSSNASRTIQSDNILYGMCKTALNLYIKQCAQGLHGIRVFSISPGTIATAIFSRGDHTRTSEQVQDYFNLLSNSVIPAGRVAEPFEVADLVSFLCSKEASYMTGFDCLIDGGLMHRA